MRSAIPTRGILALALAAIVAATVAWYAPFVGNARERCTVIQSLPATLSASGRYCLVEDLQSNGDGLNIRANGVIVDLGGHELQGPADPTLQSAGVLAQSVRHVIVRNGGVTGFAYGVRFNVRDYPGLRDQRVVRPGHVLVENLRLYGNYFRAIRVDGHRVSVRGNEIRDTGGAAQAADMFIMGIEIQGPYCSVVDNRVLDTRPRGLGEGVGISVSAYTEGCIIAMNRVSNSGVNADGRTFGIWMGGNRTGPPVIVENNSMTRLDYGVGIPTGSVARVVGNRFQEIRCVPMTAGGDDVEIAGNDVLESEPGECPDALDVVYAAAQSGDSAAMFRMSQLAESRDEQYAWSIVADAIRNSALTRHRREKLKKLLTTSEQKTGKQQARRLCREFQADCVRH